MEVKRAANKGGIRIEGQSSLLHELSDAANKLFRITEPHRLRSLGLLSPNGHLILHICHLSRRTSWGIHLDSRVPALHGSIVCLELTHKLLLSYIMHPLLLLNALWGVSVLRHRYTRVIGGDRGIEWLAWSAWI